MSSAIGGFVSTWSPSFYSTTHRVELRNVRQGGNNFLAALPLTGQAMWGGSLLATVCTVVQGPLHWIAQFFRWVFHPLIMVPLSIISCAVKERFYESSVAATIREQTKHFELGAEVPEAVFGTATLMVDDQPRHFILDSDITFLIENSIEEERDGQMKRFSYRVLRAGEVFDAECREMEREDQRIRVKLTGELPERYKNFIETNVQGRKRYFRLDNEVAEPVQGTVSIRNGHWQQRHFLVGNELPAETPNCVKIKIGNGTIHYETGKELDAPTAQSRQFTIDGKLRHFASAKYVSSPSHGLSGWINKIPKIPVKLPTRLGRITIKALEFANEHMSNIIRISILVASAVLIYFGCIAMAAGALSAVAYEYLDHDLGIIPRKVSLFMERWMPAISMVGLLIVGSLTAQIMAGITLLLMIPSVNLWVHQKISKISRSAVLSIKDQVINWLVRGERPPHFNQMLEAIEKFPSLEECDAPLIENRVLNKAQVDHILDADMDRYELNPPHLTKNFEPILNLPENRNFSELKRLWEAEGNRWIQPNTYTRVLGRLIDDERFLLMLKGRFPEAKPFHYEENYRLGNEQNRIQSEELRRAHRNQIEIWIQTLAQEKGYNNKPEFIAAWLKQQLEFFVGKLSGQRPIEGEQRLLNDAIENCAKTIPFLTNPATSQVDREDALLKLAIEGGDYCSLAMKRASREVLEGFMEPLYLQQEPDPHKAYEREVRLSLQKGRHGTIQRMYSESIVRLFAQKEELKQTGEDIHLYTALTRGLKRGLYPLATDELNEFGLTELMFKETLLLPVQVELLRMYKEGIPDAMATLGIDRLNERRNRTLDYLRNWVEQNNALSALEKDQLLNGSLANTEDNLIDAGNHRKWGRLMLYIIGTLREKRPD